MKRKAEFPTQQLPDQPRKKRRIFPETIDSSNTPLSPITITDIRGPTFEVVYKNMTPPILTKGARKRYIHRVVAIMNDAREIRVSVDHIQVIFYIYWREWSFRGIHDYDGYSYTRDPVQIGFEHPSSDVKVAMITIDKNLILSDVRDLYEETLDKKSRDYERFLFLEDLKNEIIV